jgi:hypothetical protein
MKPNTRPPEPEYVRLWREWLAKGPPRCCYTCEHYDWDGRCAKFDMSPPKEFSESLDQCEAWSQEMPF